MLTVAIVGRPNVGKSTLFNRIIGRRQAIVDDQPGVTRDRLFGETAWNGRRVQVIDTGGYLVGQRDRLGLAIVENAKEALQEADVIIGLVDSRDGVTAADRDLADLLRPLRKPLILAVNKIDHPSQEPEMLPFYELGVEEVMGVSALHGIGVGDLLDQVLSLAPPDKKEESTGEEEIRVTILGRPNVGKSTLLNRLASKQRSLVDEAPGTTRDPVDTVVKREGRLYRFVDTAGIRATGKIGSDVERYGIARAKKTITRSDVALLLMDATGGPTDTDARVFSIAHEEHRSSIILVNKWDAIEKETGTAEEFEKDIREKFSFVRYAPILFISALSGQRAHRIYQLIDTVYEMARKRIASSQLNRLLDEIKTTQPPPSEQGRVVNLYYWVQNSTAPVQFTLFVNRPQGVPEHYRRFLVNRLYDTFEFTGAPIQLRVKKSPEKTRKEFKR